MKEKELAGKEINMSHALKQTIIKKSTQCNARRSEIETPHGTVQTPMFMPVGTLANVKTLMPEELKACNSAVVLSNTYHLWLRPGEDVVKKAGGLNKFMNYD